MAQVQVLTPTPQANGSAPEAQLNDSADGQNVGSILRFSSGLILPPPEIKGALLYTSCQEIWLLITFGSIIQL